MFQFLARLFAATPTPSRGTRLTLEPMEDRCTPAVLTNPGTIRAFDPQPEPPAERVAIIRTLDSPLAARGFDPQPEPPLFTTTAGSTRSVFGS